MKHLHAFLTLLIFPSLALADLDKGLVANWTFDGGTLDDYSPYNHKGYASGDVGSVTGVKGTSISLSGTSYVTVLNVKSLPVDDGIQSFSISMWLNYQGQIGECNDHTFFDILGAPLDYTMMSNATSDFAIPETTAQYGMKLVCPSHSGWKYAYYYENAFSSRILYPSSEPPILSNHWYHIVYILDRSKNELTTYYNGNPGNEPSRAELRTSIVYDASFFTIGAASVSSSFINGEFESMERGEGFNGYIDELRIYNRVLSESEVMQLYNLSYTNPSPRKTINIVPLLNLLLE